ncbi:MAG: N-6 DNA methylase [Dysosmobacter welbionis]
MADSPAAPAADRWLKELQKQVKSTSDAIKYGNSIYGIEKNSSPICFASPTCCFTDWMSPVYHDTALVRDVLDYTEADQFDVALMNPYGGSEKADVKNHFPTTWPSSETADLFMAVIMYRLKKGGRAAVILPDGFLFGTDNAKVNLKRNCCPSSTCTPSSGCPAACSPLYLHHHQHPVL